MKALITGITGQDGSYLAEYLLSLGYTVVGIVRRSSVSTLERIRHLLNNQNLILVEGEITDAACINELIRTHQFNEIYNLAAQSHVGTSFSTPLYTINANINGPLNILEGIKKYSPSTRFYQASTSEMFGKNVSYYRSGNRINEEYNDFNKGVYPFQDEETPFAPRSPYAVAKMAAHELVKLYRDAYGIYAASGILFNHESPRRGEDFVTQKIVNWLVEYSVDNSIPKLKLGNINTYRDWGHAQDYIVAMHLMLNHTFNQKDFVIATGETHNVKDFLNAAFSYFTLNWQDHVEIDPALYRPAEVEYLLGDPAKAQAKLRWNRKYSFDNLVQDMIEAKLEKKKKRGV